MLPSTSLLSSHPQLLAAFVEDGKLPHRPSPFNSDLLPAALRSAQEGAGAVSCLSHHLPLSTPLYAHQRYQQRYAVLTRVQLPPLASHASHNLSPPSLVPPLVPAHQRYQQRYAVLKRVQLPEPLSYAAFQRAVSPAGLSVRPHPSLPPLPAACSLPLHFLAPSPTIQSARATLLRCLPARRLPRRPLCTSPSLLTPTARRMFSPLALLGTIPHHTICQSHSPTLPSSAPSPPPASLYVPTHRYPHCPPHVLSPCISWHHSPPYNLPEPLSYAAFQRAVSPVGLSVRLPFPQVPDLYQMSLDFFCTTATHLPTIQLPPVPLLSLPSLPPLPQVPELYQMSLDFFRTTATNLPTIHALAATAEPGGTAGASEAVEGEVQRLERVCASNATALFVAHRAGAGSVLKASFEFAAHPFFPVVTLKRA
ncbi:unnamed protein product [Closterium sp. Naga37s-1]|nr:unnamed protein product [Closterium sp. Naga37s-1]